VFPSWNHWPTAQVDSSGRNASFPDRAAHSSLNNLFWPLSGQQRGDVSYLEKTLMEGMTDQSATSLVSLAKSWLDAPAIETIADCRSQGYDQGQRAYVLSATGPAPGFRIAASAQQPIANLCLVVKHWGAAGVKLTLNDMAISSGKNFRFGHRQTLEGTDLIVWIKAQSQTSLKVRLERGRP